MNAKLLGANIKKYRIEKGLTQESVAEKCGFSTNYMSQIELGFRVPRLELFLMIAEALDVPTDLLVSGNVSWSDEIRSNELYKRIESLPSDKRKFVLDVMESLVSGVEEI